MDDIWPKIFTYSDVVSQRMLSSTSKRWNRFRELKKKILLTTMIAKSGYLDLLIWAEGNNYRLDWSSVCSMAAKEGHLDILKMTNFRNYVFDSEIVRDAAMNGHLEILKWLKSINIYVSSRVCYYAAWGGHLEILK